MSRALNFKRNNRVSDLEAEPQVSPSTRSRWQAQNDRPDNSGEPSSILVDQDLMCHKPAGDNLQPGETPGDTTQPSPSEVPPRMIGDFDDRANALWTLQMKEAKCHDEA
jgi:hypothetical protein